MYFNSRKLLQPEKIIICSLFVFIPLITSFKVHQPDLIKTLILKAFISFWIISHFIKIFRSKKIILPHNYLSWAIIALLVLSDLSLIFTPYKLIGIDRLELLIFFVIFYFLVTELIREQSLVIVALEALSLTGSVISAYGIFQFITEATSRASSTLGHPNLLGGYLICILPLTVALLVYSVGSLKKSIYALSVLVQTACLFLTLSRSAIICLFSAFIFFVILYRRQDRKKLSVNFNKKTTAVIFMAITVVLVFIVTLMPHILPQSELSRLTTVLEPSYNNTIYIRWLEWKGAIRIVKQNPIFGHGLGTFSIFFPSVQPDEFSKISVVINNFLRHAHNEYLEIWCEIGIFGILLFVSIQLTALFSGIRLLKYYKYNRSFILILGILTGLISISLHMLFSVSYRFVVLPLIFWAYLGMINGLTMLTIGKIKELKLTNTKLFLLIPIFLFICFFLAFSNVRAISNVMAEKQFSAGMLKNKSENYEEALDHLRTAISYNESKSEIYYLKGAIEIRLKRWSDALKTYHILQKIHPNFFHANYNISLCYLNLGDLDNCIFFGVNQLKINPYFINQYFLLGKAFYLKNNFDEAERYFKAYLNNKPIETSSREYLAKIYISRRDWDEAINQYQIILQADPSDATAILKIAELFLKSGNFEKACNSMRGIIANRLKSTFFEDDKKYFNSIINDMHSLRSNEEMPESCLEMLDFAAKINN